MSNSVTPWTVAHQAPPSMEFPRQESWSGLPFPSEGVLLDPGIEPRPPTLQADALPSEHQGSPILRFTRCQIRLSITNWEPQIGTYHGCLPAASVRIKLCTTEASGLQHPLKELRVESRNEAICVSGNWPERSLDG